MNNIILSSLGNLTLCSDIVADIELKNYLDKRIGGSISGDVSISGFLSVGENIVHGTSLTSGIGVGDSSGQPVEVEMTAVHGAAFNSSKAFGLSSFAANKGNAYAKYSAAFNDGTAYSSYSLAHGTKTSAFGYVSHVEGQYTQTGLPEQIGNDSSRQTYGAFSHAEGASTKAVGTASHAEGDQTYARGQKSHAEGGETSALGFASHSEGRNTIARAKYSHSEGANSEVLSTDDYSFVWSGKYNPHSVYYKSHGEGSFSINPKEGTNGFFIGNKSFADYLSEVGGDVDEQIARKLDKHDGGSVSGDVEVYNNDLRVLSGNYIQATDPIHVYNYSQKNTFIQAEEAFSGSGASYGPASTGSYGYCVLSVVNGTNYRGLKLSGDISKLTALLNNNATGAGINYDYGASKSLKVVLNDTTSISNALFSLALSDQGETMKYQISSIDQARNIVYLKQAFSTATAGLTSLTEADCIDLWQNDDNAFYVAGFPEIGNAVVKNFYAQHVEGGSSRAVGKYTHAEGRDNIADVRYSHAEGSHNIAASMASHAEGFQNKVLGKYAHVEGNLNVVNGLYAHAEGKNTAASGNQSHAEGFNTVASGAGSHAEGGNGTSKGGTATGGGSHAEGINSLASGAGSHAEGWLTYATSYAAHVEGNATSADVRAAHAEGGFGYDKSISSYNAAGQATKSTVVNIPYNGAFAHKMAAHAEGAGTHAEGIASHAEGCGSYVKANCHGAHAEGGEVKSTTHREYDSSGRLSAQWTEYECINQTSAMNVAAHAEGLATQAKGKASHAAGISSVVSGNYSYAWNGLSSCAYHAKNDGSFSINPVNGMAGIYVGNHSLAEMSLPVSSLSTTVVYNDGTVSVLLIESNLLPASIPNKTKVVDVTIGNAVKNIAAGAFKGFTSLTNVIIPNSVSAVQNQAFYQCSHLTGLSFPDSVLSIDYSAMSKCSNLRIVKLPNNLQKLTDFTFYQCSSLVDVHIPNSVSSIGKQCFESCSKLVHVNVPNAVSSIGLSAFLNCTNLVNVEFEYKTADQISNIVNYSATPARWGIADENAIKPYVWSRPDGCFNVNPNDGLSGFYIGQDNFIQCVLSAIQMMSDTQKTALKNELGLS